MSARADLETLVAFPTVSARPVVELAAWLAHRLEDLGFRVERFDTVGHPGKCNLVATIGPAGTDGLVLTGHMDVVPTEDQPWTSDPFRVIERGGRLYGRGTADMKGFFAATLQALARIPASAWRRELVLIWTHDEEVGCMGSAHLVEHLAESDRPFPRACLVGEPTSFQVLRMHPGHVAVEIEARGVAAHSSRPDLGVNAIELAAEAVLAVREVAHELAEERFDLPFERPWVPVNVATVDGGSAINIVPDRCVLRLGYRPMPGMAPETVFHRIEERIKRLDRRRSGLDDLSCRMLRVTPSLLTPEGTPLGELLRPHAVPTDAPAASFATDGGNLSKLGMLPLIFGPGSIEVAHKADEFIPIDELDRAVDILEQVVRARCC